MYNKEEVFNKTLEYFDGDELPTNVWIDKYALKDKYGNIYELNPDDMHRRLAKEFARIEQKYINPLSEEEIYHLLKEFKYIIPGGSQMSGIGNNFIFTSLSNCFVVESAIDSYGGIMKTDQEQVQVMKRRGGVGHDISNLRPSGALANNSTLKGMSGATLYMERFSNSTREVSQGDRRGALMLSIDVRHPDVDKFIDIKMNSNKVTGANISVRISDEFMIAVENDEDFIQLYPINSDIVGFNKEMVPYDKLLSFDKSIYNNNSELTPPKYFKKIKARELWDKIIHNSHSSAEPGVLFWDQITKESPAGCYGEEWQETSTNPCGEIPLNPYDSCRLTAINLYSYIINPFTIEAKFNFELFKKHVRIAQRLMDDLIDLEVEKLDAIIDKIKSDPELKDIKQVELNLWEKIKQKAIEGRRTGLGITAEGDMIAALGMIYGSDEAVNMSEQVHKIMAVESYLSSIKLAEERGSFPIWDFKKEKQNPFLGRVMLEGQEIYGQKYFNDYFKYGRRNIANLTIAPTGTVSLMTQTTSGLEPLFQPFYKRRRKIDREVGKVDFIDEMGDKWEEYFIIHPKFIEWFIRWNELGLTYQEGVNTLQLKTEKELQLIFEISPYFQSIANDIDWENKVEMQGRIQKWIDHSISVTTNLPESATIEDVNKIYLKAWRSGCKGQTIYRDGSRSGVLISNKEQKTTSFDYSQSFKRPKVTEVDIYHKTALKKQWMVIVGKVDNKPYEIFVLKDVDNIVFPSKIEKGTLTKVKSKTYKLNGFYGEKGYTIDNIVEYMSESEQVNTRKFSAMLRHGMHPKYISKEIGEYATIVSFDKVVQRVLMKYFEEDNKKEKCPQCGSENLKNESGCVQCMNPECGWSKCG